jgi:NAD(P)-dependent dehydrogenase (short-subunit alcohol dehydrogenase family)
MSERRAALVTGGASGIGRATVERFLADGWDVVAADLNAETGGALISQLEARGLDGRVDFVRVDVSVEVDVEAAVSRVTERYGRLDCVVNNAGLGGAFGPITEIEVEDWDYTFAVLTRGVFLGIKHGARAMRALGAPGSIVNTGSIAGLVGGVGPQAYSAAKAAVLSLTRLAAVELAPFRIRVNAVNPGFIATPIHGRNVERIGDLVGDVQPWPEIGRADQVASVICFLAGDEAGFITGEAITVDGGVIAAGPRTGDRVGGDPAARGLVGLARGTTGEQAVVRRRLPPGGAGPAVETH